MVERNRDITVGAKFVAKDEVTRPIERIARTTTRATKSMTTDFRRLEMSVGKLSSTFARMGSLIGGPILAASKEAARRNRDLANSFTVNEVAVKRFNDILGKAAAPAIMKIGIAMNEMVDRLQKMDPEMIKQVVNIGLLTAKVLLGFSAFLKITQTITSLLPLLASMKLAVVGAIGPWGVLALAIIGATTAIVRYNSLNTSGKIRESLAALQEQRGQLSTRASELGGGQLADPRYARSNQPYSGTGASNIERRLAIEKEIEVIDRQILALKKDLAVLDKASAESSQKRVDYGKLLAQYSKEMKLAEEKMRKEGELTDRNIYRDKRGDWKAGAKEGLEASLREFYNFNNQARKMMEGLFQDIEGFFGDYFYNLMKGNFENLTELVKDFGDMLLRMLSELAANKFIDMLLGGNGKKLSPDQKRAAGLDEPESFAGGGFVRRSGAAIVHKGENIIPSINGSMRIPAPATRAVTGGGGGNVTVVVQSWDAQDVLRNSGAITKAVVDGMSRNGGIRQGMKRYL